MVKQVAGQVCYLGTLSKPQQQQEWQRSHGKDISQAYVFLNFLLFCSAELLGGSSLKLANVVQG